MKKLIKNLISAVFLFSFWLIAWWLFKVRNKLTINGKENIPQSTGILFLSNHQSLIDSLVIAYALFRPWDIIKRFSYIPWNAAAWENFFKKPSRRIFCYFLKIIPAYRGGSMQTIDKNIIDFKKILNNSNLLLYFAGTRSRDESIGTCRYGPAKIIADLNPTIIPIRLYGMDKVMPISIGFKWHKIRGGQNIVINIGQPINFNSTDIKNIRHRVVQLVDDL
ncbi:MAG: lysophospholipid acyltransferase family protein [Patescibacteria group bacterium]|nr:lysophospholipid acyltransferase family protein [Patescibacteria group bacterium]